MVNGVQDKIHDQSYYPALASEIPGGRFFYLPVEEQQREELIALAAFEFARDSGSLDEYERTLRKPLPRRLDPSGCRDV